MPQGFQLSPEMLTWLFAQMQAAGQTPAPGPTASMANPNPPPYGGAAYMGNPTQSYRAPELGGGEWASMPGVDLPPPGYGGNVGQDIIPGAGTGGGMNFVPNEQGGFSVYD